MKEDNEILRGIYYKYENEKNDRFFKKKIYSKNSNVTKIVSMVLVLGIFSFGMVQAASKIYQNVWKEPEQYNISEVAKLPEEITEEEKKELISEDEAKNNAIEILKKIGYENPEINRIELKRGYDSDIESYYMVKTKYGYEEGVEVQIHALTGDVIYIENRDLKYQKQNPDIIDEDTAKEIGIETLKKFGMDESKYFLCEVKEEEHYFQNVARKLWYVSYAKEYYGIKNNLEKYIAVFYVKDGKTIIEILNKLEDYTYQENEIILSKDEAINIARNKETEFSNQEIIDIQAELAIEKMNSWIYILESDDEIYETVTQINELGEEYTVTKQKDDSYYKVDDIARTVWKVTVSHDSKNGWRMAKDDMKEYIKQYVSKIYYIDASTGEIIGGSSASIGK